MIYSGSASRDVIKKIEDYHIPYLETMFGVKYVVGYRSVEHELAMGRSGKSQHTFMGKGAVDVTTSDPVTTVHELMLLPYQRVAYYPHKKFFHLDYKGDQKLWFLSDENSRWSLSDPEQIIKTILRNRDEHT